MTDIVYDPRREDPLSDTEPIINSGYVVVRLSRAALVNGQMVQDIWSDPIEMDGTAKTLKLDAVADPPYELWHKDIDDGNGGKKEIHEYRVVTSSGTALNWFSLVQQGGPGAPVVVDSSLTARVAALEAQITSVSGGATNLAGISDMPTVMKDFNKSTSKGNALTYLGAGSSNLVIGTTSTTAKAGNYQPTAEDISNSSAIGRSLLKAADQAAVQTIVGATGGGSSLVIGTTAGTAADGLVVANLSTTVGLKADKLNPILTDPIVGTQPLTDNSTKGASTAFVRGLSFWSFGGLPTIRYTGSSWPTKVSRTPPGYTGLFQYDSSYYANAPTPSDMAVGDAWDRKK